MREKLLQILGNIALFIFAPILLSVIAFICCIPIIIIVLFLQASCGGCG